MLFLDLGPSINLILSDFIEVPVPSQESQQSCICMLGVFILPLSTIILLQSGKCSDRVVFFPHYIVNTLWPIITYLVKKKAFLYEQYDRK